MALMDTIEALAASYNKGVITLPFAACVIGVTSIKELLNLALHFNVEFVGTNPISRKRLNTLEKELDSWRTFNQRQDV